LWNQCGGDGWPGPSCCEGSSSCQPKPLKDFPSYKQCRPPPPPACEDATKGSTCFNHVMWDIKVGVHKHPEWYKGLNVKSPFKEFQEFEFAINKDLSKCSMPCAPGTCYFVFRYEGCDSVDEWSCDNPDNSVASKCCCEYFHGRVHADPPKKPSEAIVKAMSAAASKKPELFCTMAMQPQGYEVDLVRAQYARGGGVGIFGCDTFAVYSSATVLLSPWGQVPVVGTYLINGSWDGVSEGEFHDPPHLGMFRDFWSGVVENPDSGRADWIVKVDPDTVFVVGRLRAVLLSGDSLLGKKPPDTGLFVGNCPKGLRAPIEVLSQTALQTFKNGRSTCEKGKPAKEKDEGAYLEACLSYLGVWKVPAYNTLFEGGYACEERPSSWNPFRPPCFAPQVAFHPFKTINSFMHCYNETANHPWALPIGADGGVPNSKNQHHA